MHTAYNDWEHGDRPSVSVVETVAEATGTEPANMQPLYEVVDPDALDELMEPDLDRPGLSRSIYVTFRFEDCDVAVHADGRTVVAPRSGGQPAHPYR